MVRVGKASEKVIIYAPRRLTPTERKILLYVSHHNGEAFAKGDLAEELGRNKKTVDRLIARLRSEGLLVSEPVWDEHGGQRANVYRIASGEGQLVAQVLE